MRLKKLSILLAIIQILLTACVSSISHFPQTEISLTLPYSDPDNSISNVTGPIRPPYTHICRLNVKRQKVFFWQTLATSTATLLKDGNLITAAHNFYSPWYNEVVAFFMESGVGTQQGIPAEFKKEIEIKNINDQILVNETYCWGPFSADVAFVKTSMDSKSYASKSPFRLATEEELKNISNKCNEGCKIDIYIAGYPAEGHYTYNNKDYEYEGQCLVHLKTYIKEIKAGVIEYGQMKTYGGMSGSPVWIVNETTNSKEYVIIGIHVTNGGAYLLEANMLSAYKSWADH